MVHLAVSLALEWVVAGNVAPAFEFVRRAPPMALSISALFALRNLDRRRSSATTAPEAIDLSGVAWIRGAGNYLELHAAGGQPKVVRATLSAVMRDHAGDFVRVHRSYLVRRSSIARIDAASVLLANGKRVPLGQRYRMAVSPA